MNFKLKAKPLYRLSSEICVEMCWVCKINLMRSSGALAVTEMAAEIPPARKSLMKIFTSETAVILISRLSD